MPVPVVIQQPRQQRQRQPQPQLQHPREPQSATPGVLRRAKSHRDGLASENFKPQKKRPLSWPSPSLPIRTVVTQPPLKVDQETSRVYDLIASPASKAKKAESGHLEYNKLSYEGYPMKKPPYPSCHDSLALASMYSRLNADVNPLHFSAVHVAAKPVTSAAGVSDEKKRIGGLQMKAGPCGKMSKEVDEIPDKGYPMPPYNEVASPSPLYSNVKDDRNSSRAQSSQPTPVYSVPDLGKKRERQNQPMKELPIVTASPHVYSNLKAEMAKPSQSTPGPVYSVPDMNKKWESRKMKKQDEGGQGEATEQAQQMRTLPPRHHLLSSSPLYSSVDDDRGLTKSMPALDHGVSDKDYAFDGFHTKDVWTTETAEQSYQMKELTPWNENSPLYSNVNEELSSFALYSNVNAEMHPVRITQSQKSSTPVYSVPDMNKKKSRAVNKDQANGDPQLSLQRRTSPSPPPLPLPLTAESLGEDMSNFYEPRYPYVSVPSHTRTLKPMPSDIASNTGHVYDHPKRRDIYKPLPLEGNYDSPPSNPRQVLTDEAGRHYDIPSCLLLVAKRSGTARKEFMSGEGEKNLSRQRENI